MTNRRPAQADDIRPRTSLSIVMPAFNEEQNIERALDNAARVGGRLFDQHEVIVVDDGSDDRTAEFVAKRAEVEPTVRLVRHDRNLGYGQAVRSGLMTASLDLVFLTDSDNQFDLDELERFLPWIDHVGVVAGYRMKRQDPIGRRLGAAGWNHLVRALYHVPIRDIDCAFKLFRRPLLDDIELQAVGAMVSTELMVKLARSGCSVVEIGVRHYPRTAGKPSGASPKVVLTAGMELIRMHGRLKRWRASAGAVRQQALEERPIYAAVRYGGEGEQP